jgi:nardilysin
LNFRELRLHVVSSSHRFYFDRFKAVEIIDFTTFKEFLMNFLPSLRFKILIQGNFNTKQALEMKDICLKNLHFEKRNVQVKEIRPHIHKIPRGVTFLKVKSLLPKDGNSIVKNFYQIDSTASIESSCLLELLVKILREPLFNTLRTREQLGYSVSCAAKNDNDIFGLSIIAESQERRNSARLVDARIEKFLWDFFSTKLSEMCDADFETMKRSIVNQRRSLDIDLESEVSRNWCEIRERKYNFERNEIEARQLEILDKNALKIFFSEHILGAQRRKLSVQVLANIDDDDLLLQHGYVHLSLCGDDEQNCVRDLAKFKQSLETFTRR